jgi:hypothetical protein
MLAFHLTEGLLVEDPVVGLAFEAVGTLVVEAFVETLEDAAVPKVSVSLGANPHLLLLLPLSLLQFSLEVLEQLGWHHEQSLVVHLHPF